MLELDPPQQKGKRNVTTTKKGNRNKECVKCPLKDSVPIVLWVLLLYPLRHTLVNHLRKLLMEYKYIKKKIYMFEIKKFFGYLKLKKIVF